VTVAVAIDVELPSATIDARCSETDTLGASAQDGAAKYQLSAIAATASAATAEKRNRSL
jgi:hypothetical protein